jgi:hypothetical protein
MRDAVAAVSPLPDNPGMRFGMKEDEGRRNGTPHNRFLEQYDNWPAEMEKMVASYVQQRHDDQVAQDLSLPITIPICRLLRSIEGLSNRLPGRTWKFFKEFGYQHLETDDQEIQPTDGMFTSLSCTERARRYRACFRFQTYCNLYHRMPHPTYFSSDYPNGYYELGTAIVNLLSKNSPWENEELFCVYQYLFSELGDIFDHV